MVGGWWTFYHGRVGSIFNVSRHFTYPRDAKFCDEYASKDLVLITSLYWRRRIGPYCRRELCHGSLFEIEIAIAVIGGLFLASAFFWLI